MFLLKSRIMSLKNLIAQQKSTLPWRLCTYYINRWFSFFIRSWKKNTLFDSVILEPLLRVEQVFVWFQMRTRNNQTMKICVCSKDLQFFSMEQLISKHPSPRCLIVSQKKNEVRSETVPWSVGGKSANKWRCNRKIHVFLRWQPWRRRLREVSVNVRIQLSFYDTTTTIFTSITSTIFSNPFDAKLSIHF